MAKNKGSTLLPELLGNDDEFQTQADGSAIGERTLARLAGGDSRAFSEALQHLRDGGPRECWDGFSEVVTKALVRKPAADHVGRAQVEEGRLCVRKALGIALALSEKPGGDEHDRFAIEAISDILIEAQEILEAKEPAHG